MAKDRRGPRPHTRGPRPHTWLAGPDEINHRLYTDCQRARAQANFRNEGWTITEQEYIDLWRQDDRYLRKGRKLEDLCLTRIDRTKPWSTDNVEIITREKHFKMGYSAIEFKESV